LLSFAYSALLKLSFVTVALAVVAGTYGNAFCLFRCLWLAKHFHGLFDAAAVLLLLLLLLLLTAGKDLHFGGGEATL